MKRFISFLILSIIILLAASTLLQVKSCGEKLWGANSDTISLPPVDNNLRLRIDSFLTNSPIEGCVGLEIYDITAQKEVYSYNKDSLMSPASCMKLLTCTAALHYMDANMPLRNRLYISGDMKGDTLVGNLILKTQFDAAFNRDTLNHLLDDLKHHGITCIKGN